MKEDAKNIREPNKAGMPQVPKWEKLRRKLKCQKCKYSGNGVVYKYILLSIYHRNNKIPRCRRYFFKMINKFVDFVFIILLVLILYMLSYFLQTKCKQCLHSFMKLVYNN